MRAVHYLQMRSRSPPPSTFFTTELDGDDVLCREEEEEEEEEERKTTAEDAREASPRPFVLPSLRSRIILRRLSEAPAHNFGNGKKERGRTNNGEETERRGSFKKVLSP